MQQLQNEGLAKMQAAEMDVRLSRRPIERYEWPLGRGVNRSRLVDPDSRTKTNARERFCCRPCWQGCVWRCGRTCRGHSYCRASHDVPFFICICRRAGHRRVSEREIRRRLQPISTDSKNASGIARRGQAPVRFRRSCLQTKRLQQGDGIIQPGTALAGYRFAKQRAITTWATRFISAAKHKRVTTKSSATGQMLSIIMNKLSSSTRKTKRRKTTTITSKRKIEELKNKKQDQPSPSPSPPQKNNQNKQNKQDRNSRTNSNNRTNRTNNKTDNNSSNNSNNNSSSKARASSSKKIKSNRKISSHKAVREPERPTGKERSNPGEERATKETAAATAWRDSFSLAGRRKTAGQQPSPSPGEQRAQESPSPGEGENESPSPSPGEGEEENASTFRHSGGIQEIGR